jgi:hypothetical protein
VFDIHKAVQCPRSGALHKTRFRRNGPQGRTAASASARTIRPYLPFFAAAHRLRCASAMRFRVAALNFCDTRLACHALLRGDGALAGVLSPSMARTSAIQTLIKLRLASSPARAVRKMDSDTIEFRGHCF